MPPRVGYTGPRDQQIKAWRKDRKLTLQQLADATGTTKAHLSLVERGFRGLTPDLADRIAARLGITVDVLMGREPPGEDAGVEADLLTLFRGLSEKAKRAVLDNARAIASLDRGE